ncbi:hypothetical protein PHPALM_28421 [Phytophthora palmivora]|uniref:Dynein heavy chain AAA module D4 domain-containing protein n=1 Tax=Phytophthora palmivora TaxID=4796 RepID=A0A2P4XA92_9STRA|nr:hypothetical protein PHPALM_28421 [Phytophthora palmivora]
MENRKDNEQLTTEKHRREVTGSRSLENLPPAAHLQLPPAAEREPNLLQVTASVVVFRLGAYDDAWRVTFHIEISKSYSRTEWRNDIKKVLQLSGLNNQPTVFLFLYTQIVEEAYLEDINGLLNTGEVANLWANDELVQMNEALEPAAPAAGVNTGNSTELYNFFVGRFRTNLHIVLALSPIGEAFRRRLRMFPSLVNCCTIDWFAEWPDEALRSMAVHFLVNIELPAQVKVGIVHGFVRPVAPTLTPDCARGSDSPFGDDDP